MPGGVKDLIRGFRVVAGSLVVCLVFFGALAIWTPVSKQADPEGTLLMEVWLGIVALGCAALYLVGRRSLVRRTDARDAGSRQEALFSGAVLIEVPGLLALLAYHQTGGRVFLGVAVGAVVLFLLHLLSVVRGSRSQPLTEVRTRGFRRASHTRDRG